MNTRINLRGLLASGLVLLAGGTAALGYDYIRNTSTGLPIKWPDASVGLTIMLDNTATKTDGTTLATSARGAALTWSALLGSSQFSPTIAAGTPTDHNHVNELAMASKVYTTDFDPNTIAVTTAWRLGNDRTEADIIFNSAKTWDSYSGNLRASGGVNIQDIHRVALHEMGHILGLDHPDEATPVQTVSAVMNSHISNLDTLSMDDITGAQNLYGPPGPPANDSFANAITIPLTNRTVTVTGFNTLATKQAGEPSHAGDNGGHSVWWKWTAPTGGSVTLDTRGSYFDTTLGVYTGSSISTLTTIISNDDITAGVVQASTVTFNATSGTTYFVAVDGFDGDTAGITLNMTFDPNALTFTTQPVSQTVTVGGSASFSVAATGPGTLTYQWSVGGTAIGGATASTYSLSNVQLSNAGSYTATVSNGANTITSNAATLTVNAPVVTPVPTPAPSSGGGGGGGGAPSVWFFAALSALSAARLRKVAPASSR